MWLFALITLLAYFGMVFMLSFAMTGIICMVFEIEMTAMILILGTAGLSILQLLLLWLFCLPDDDQ